jgi:hypothetical protein
MAEGKKSFVLYTDLIHVIKKLPNEQRGKLFLHLLEYVNDMNPTTDDILVEIAFEPIRLQLKRDLKEWEEIRKKRSESGKLGGRPKSEEKQNKAKKANGFLEKQSEAKKAVNVTVNDTVNVNNNKAFVADANQDEKQFRKYLFDTIKEKQSSRDVLFKNNNIDLSLRNELWESFIKNAILNTPLIENDKHAWNTFKKYVTDNKNDFILKAKFEGFE